MNDQENSGELFYDGTPSASGQREVIVDRGECGRSFGLSKETYCRLARCALNCCQIGVEPSELYRLGEGEPGVRCILYGKHYAYAVVVRAGQISLSALLLDGTPESESLLFLGSDLEEDWWCLTKHIFTAEGVHLTTSYD